MSDETILVAMLASEVAVIKEGATIRSCDRCGQSVVIAPSSLGIEVDAVWCVPCTIKRAAEEIAHGEPVEIVGSEKNVRDARRWLRERAN